jgi:hypothetical protein
VFGLAQRSFGTLVLDYHFLPPSFDEQFSADLRDKRWSARTGIGIQYRVYHDIALVSSVEYRWLKFPELRGNGTYTERRLMPANESSYSSYFPAQLGEADGYFGLMIPSEFSGYVPTQLLHTLWSSTPAQEWWYTEKPTALDLSGIGISFGIRYEF